MNLSHEADETRQHQDGEGQEMQTGQSLWQPLVIARQPTKAGRPGEGTLDVPAPRQEHEALPVLRQLHDLQLDGVTGRIGRRLLTGIALVDQGQLDRLAGPASISCASWATCARSCSSAGVTCSAKR